MNLGHLSPEICGLLIFRPHCRRPTEPPPIDISCCFFHFLGIRCQLEDQCLSSPCGETARCITSPINGQYMCDCGPGWEGDDCHTDVNECELHCKYN